MVILFACFSNQLAVKQTSTNGADISISDTVFPDETRTIGTTSSIVSSKFGTSNPEDLTAVVSLGLTEFAVALSATPQPYWDLLPLNKTPEGGWKTYTNTQYGFSFEYPLTFDTESCGKLTVTQSAQQLKINDDGGTIFITVTPVNGMSLERYAEGLVDKNGYLPLTPVDHFRIDDIPAVRFILPMGLPSSAQYQKLALLIHKDKFYLFEYSFVNFFWCDAPPISEEAVYEHLISTWQFLP
jgi:hypothetical protein